MPLARFERATLNLGGSCSVQSELQGLKGNYSTLGTTRQTCLRFSQPQPLSTKRVPGQAPSHVAGPKSPDACKTAGILACSLVIPICASCQSLHPPSGRPLGGRDANSRKTNVERDRWQSESSAPPRTRYQRKIQNHEHRAT